MLEVQSEKRGGGGIGVNIRVIMGGLVLGLGYDWGLGIMGVVMEIIMGVVVLFWVMIGGGGYGGYYGVYYGGSGGVNIGRYNECTQFG